MQRPLFGAQRFPDLQAQNLIYAVRKADYTQIFEICKNNSVNNILTKINSKSALQHAFYNLDSYTWLYFEKLVYETDNKELIKQFNQQLVEQPDYINPEYLWQAYSDFTADNADVRDIIELSTAQYRFLTNGGAYFFREMAHVATAWEKKNNFNDPRPPRVSLNYDALRDSFKDSVHLIFLRGDTRYPAMSNICHATDLNNYEYTYRVKLDSEILEKLYNIRLHEKLTRLQEADCDLQPMQDEPKVRVKP